MTELKLSEIKNLLPNKIEHTEKCRYLTPADRCYCSADDVNKLIDDLSTKNLLDYVEADWCQECLGFGKTVVRTEDNAEDYVTCPDCEGRGAVIRVKEWE